MNKAEYKLKFAEHLEQVGPNPGIGYLAKWGWHAEQERNFRKKLAAEGVDLGSCQ